MLSLTAKLQIITKFVEQTIVEVQVNGNRWNLRLMNRRKCYCVTTGKVYQVNRRFAAFRFF